ncbi:MAG: T9SS type A sorting domain-containing protein [Candidatus Marinimicrobia bacterium]|nr:T9SS type A sorting domain-containing protein [Candidatus Neomarinimicrobiota bacterium]
MVKSISFLLPFLMGSLAIAHVDLDYPVGGETFFIGDTVLIEWHPRQEHDPNNWDIEYSDDGGSTWSIIVEDIPVPQESYLWVVSQDEADEAYIKIIQDNVGANYAGVSGPITILAEPVNLFDKNSPIMSYALEQNYPNPFNPTTIISYTLPEQSIVKLTVLDIKGQEVTILSDSDKPPGSYEVQWNGMDQSDNPVSTGVYFCRIKAQNFRQTIKMVYLR